MRFSEIKEGATSQLVGKVVGKVADNIAKKPSVVASTSSKTDDAVRPEVKTLQKMLKDRGYDLGNWGPNKDGIDGIMGFYTQKALDAFRKNIPPSAVAKPTIKSADKKELEMSSNFIMPLKGKITSLFGKREAPKPGASTNHPGVDIAAPIGSPVRAPENAVVQKISDNPTAGLHINLGNGKGVLMHRLLHLSDVKVKEGDIVKQGEVIASSGNSGLSTGPHLHWERYEQGKLVDPLA
jgi:murein DD-endopeptidase MepM/ murein hydrolase activator NlpD